MYTEGQLQNLLSWPSWHFFGLLPAETQSKRRYGFIRVLWGADSLDACAFDI
jgi:hypothetical protein